MTGPEHLREGKRLLATCERIEGSTAAQAMATVASAHLQAAQVIAFASAHLPERISWQQAGDA